MRQHPLFDELDASLAALIPNESVEFVGNWLPATRRTYQSVSQSDTGAGPFVDVVDLRWRGTLSCAEPIACVAFLVTSAELFWAKSIPAACGLAVDVSLHAYADYTPERATFTASIGGALLPGTAVTAATDLADVCALEQNNLTTARVHALARTEDADVVVLLIQGQFLETGRHRLWRIREELASALPPRIREILTRRRSGSVRW